MTPQELSTYSTVRKYISELADKATPREIQDERMAILAEFCDFVGRTPDQMLAEVYDAATQKYKRRNFYSDQVKLFSSQISGPWNVQTARGNVIRGFFIANGRRLHNARPDWL
jgi:hypothetical protein